MRGVSGLTQRFRPSTNPLAPAKSSGSRFSLGERIFLLGGRVTWQDVILNVFPLTFFLSPRTPCYCPSMFFSLSHSPHVSIYVSRPLPRGPGDVIGDCKIQFLDEIYQLEKAGAPALSAADGQFKRMQQSAHTLR